MASFGGLIWLVSAARYIIPAHRLVDAPPGLTLEGPEGDIHT